MKGVEMREKGTYSISVVIITHNRPRLLRNCLPFLINQNYPKNKYEIVIIDDGSIENIEPVVKDFNNTGIVRLIKIKHSGCGAARNYGIKMARNEIIAFANDDYIVDKDWLREINNIFNKDTDMMGARFRRKNISRNFFSLAEQASSDSGFKIYLTIFNSKKDLVSILLALIKNTFFYKEKLTKGPIFLNVHGASALKQEVFTRIGYFDESLKRGEDVDFVWRLRKNNIPSCYSYYLAAFHDEKIGIKRIWRQSYNNGRLDKWIFSTYPEYKKIGRFKMNSAIYLFLYIFIFPFIKAIYAHDILRGAFYLPVFFISNVLSAVGMLDNKGDIPQ